MTDPGDTWQHQRARIAALSRSRPDGDPELEEARVRLRQLRGENVQDERVEALISHITRELHTEPYFTEAQLDRIINATLEAPRSE
jgi:hypothetical protein